MRVDHSAMARRAKAVSTRALEPFEIGNKKEFITVDRSALKDILNQPSASDYKNIQNHIKKIEERLGVSLGEKGEDNHIRYTLHELYLILDGMSQLEPKPKYFNSIPQALRFKEAFVLAISNLKGGTGKSSTVIHLAIALALANYRRPRILIIDADPQGQVYLSMDGRAIDFNEQPSVGSVCMKIPPKVKPSDMSQRDWLKRDVILPSHVENIDFIAGQPDDQGIQDFFSKDFKRGKSDEWDAYRALNKEIIEPLKGDYDIIIIDLPPSNTKHVASAIYAADGVLKPVAVRPMDTHSTLSYMSILSDWMSDFEDFLSDEYKPAKFLKVLPLADEGTNVSNSQIRKLKQAYTPEHVLQPIPFARAYGVANADNNKTLFDYENQSAFIGVRHEWKQGIEAWSMTADRVLSFIEDAHLDEEDLAFDHKAMADMAQQELCNTKDRG
ncbi:hypothetical protein VCHA53O466_50417 [Vibrio chagasii]|nr:hypothetical protein VCHA53O466_50417 [Vibrio chagasii]